MKSKDWTICKICCSLRPMQVVLVLVSYVIFQQIYLARQLEIPLVPRRRKYPAEMPVFVIPKPQFDGRLNLGYDPNVIGGPGVCPPPRAALIGILSTADAANTARRRFLRHLYSEVLREPEVDVAFFFGAPRTDAQAHLLHLEMKSFDDMIMTKRAESRDDGKILDWFQYARDNAYSFDTAHGVWCRKYLFIGKGDDDAVIHTVSLTKYLLSLNTSVSHFVGAYFQDYTQIEKELVEGMHGMLYLLSSEIVEWIHHSPVPLNHVVGIEDQQVALWLKKSKVAFNRTKTELNQFHDYYGAQAVYGGKVVNFFRHATTSNSVVIHNCKNLSTLYSCASELLERKDDVISSNSRLLTWVGLKGRSGSLLVTMADAECRRLLPRIKERHPLTYGVYDQEIYRYRVSTLAIENLSLGVEISRNDVESIADALNSNVLIHDRTSSQDLDLEIIEKIGQLRSTRMHFTLRNTTFDTLSSQIYRTLRTRNLEEGEFDELLTQSLVAQIIETKSLPVNAMIVAQVARSPDFLKFLKGHNTTLPPSFPALTTSSLDIPALFHYISFYSIAVLGANLTHAEIAKVLDDLPDGLKGEQLPADSSGKKGTIKLQGAPYPDQGGNALSIQPEKRRKYNSEILNSSILKRKVEHFVNGILGMRLNDHDVTNLVPLLDLETVTNDSVLRKLFMIVSRRLFRSVASSLGIDISKDERDALVAELLSALQFSNTTISAVVPDSLKHQNYISWKLHVFAITRACEKILSMAQSNQQAGETLQISFEAIQKVSSELSSSVQRQPEAGRSDEFLLWALVRYTVRSRVKEYHNSENSISLNDELSSNIAHDILHRPAHEALLLIQKSHKDLLDRQILMSIANHTPGFNQLQREQMLKGAKTSQDVKKAISVLISKM